MSEAEVLIDENGKPYVKLGKYRLRFEEEEFDGFYIKKAEDELRETPDLVDQSIEEFRELVRAEEGLYVPLDDALFCIKYLRPNKFYATSAFRVMRKYYKFKLKYPKFSSDLIPPTVERAFTDEIVQFFPKRTSAGSRIIMIHVGRRWIPKEVSLTILIKSLLLALEIAMGEPKTQVGGIHIILDLNGLSLTQITQFTPSLAKMILWVVQDCVAIRLKGVYVINQLPIFKLVYRIFKPFLGEKLKSRLNFIGTDWDALKMQIDGDCLPEKCGGTLDCPPCPGYYLYQVIEHYQDRYEEFMQYGYQTEKGEEIM